jgi:hypothetical protein
MIKSCGARSREKDKNRKNPNLLISDAIDACCGILRASECTNLIFLFLTFSAEGENRCHPLFKLIYIEMWSSTMTTTAAADEKQMFSLSHSISRL